ncbi:YadA-like family protein [Comamonadaceae bacterium M7527]|nr:YadA-like family protein [Comamonadaceae bacterium M7527]
MNTAKSAAIAAAATDATTKANSAKSAAIAAAATDATTKANSAKSAAIAAAKTETETQVKALADGTVKTNTAGITKLNADATVAGSVANQVNTAKSAAIAAAATDATTKANSAKSAAIAAAKTETETQVKALDTKITNLENGQMAANKTALEELGKTFTKTDSSVTVKRINGTEALSATATATALKGGTGTTVQTLRDQKDGNSGVYYQTTMYDANGVEMTTTNTPAMPTGATGTITENGVNKWVTDVRLGGVAAAVNDNDAVNLKQLTDLLGKNTSTAGEGASAAGDNANADGTGANANGTNSSATGANATATGNGTTATGKGATATGAGSNANGAGATTNGTNATADGTKATATGNGTTATGEGATATGAGSNANGAGATATGAGSQATGTGSTANGTNASASGTGSVANGTGATASGHGSVALGGGSVASEDNTVSVGGGDGSPNNPVTRRITNVANGTGNQDAATIAQLNSIVTIDKDANTQAATGTLTLKDDIQGTTTATVYTKAQADKEAQAKVDALATGQVDTNAKGVAANATNIGNRTGKTTTLTADVDAINARLRTRANRKGKRADGRKRPTFGGGTEAVTSLHATGANDPADDKAEVTVSYSEVAIVRGDGKVVFDADNDATKQTVLRGGTGTTIQTLRDQDKGVAAGTGNSGVNYQTTMYGLNGDNNAEYTTDATAFNTFNTNGTLPVDAPAGATGIINEGGVYKYVTNVRIGGVAAGVQDNEAVNKKQLDDALQGVAAGADLRIDTNTQGIANNRQRIDANSKRIDGNTQGIANVTAMASMPALPTGAESGFSAGVGGYSGKNAVAIGFQHRLSANTTFKVAAATGSNGKATVGAGFSYSWGGSNRSAPAQGQQVVALQDQLRVQATENADLKQRMAALMARVESLEAKSSQ